MAVIPGHLVVIPGHDQWESRAEWIPDQAGDDGSSRDDALASNCRPRASCPAPRAARRRKRVSASNSANIAVAMSSIRRFSGVPRLLASSFSRRCLSSDSLTVRTNWGQIPIKNYSPAANSALEIKSSPKK